MSDVSLISLFCDNLEFRLFTLLILGMCIGSFMNVVVYRLPIILNKVWRNQCVELLADECQLTPNTDKFTLSYPASHCPKCKSPVPWWSNIPLFGYILLRGKCVGCSQKISLRYPIVEVVTGLLFAAAAWRYDDPIYVLWAVVFLSIIFCLMLIDLDTFLLPDELTLPLIWLGLLANLHGYFSGSLVSSVIGAVIGYMSLWTIYWAFKLLTGKEGMGYGDFKLLAAICAWLGWQSVVTVLLFSSCLGIVYAVIMRLTGKLESGNPIPFGPFLGGGAVFAMVFGQLVFPINGL